MTVARYVVVFDRAVERPPDDVVKAHRRRLSSLAAAGVVCMAGAFEGGGGLVVFDAPSDEEAQSLVAADPFVLEGTHRFTLRRWNQDIDTRPARA